MVVVVIVLMVEDGCPWVVVVVVGGLVRLFGVVLSSVAAVGEDIPNIR